MKKMHIKSPPKFTELFFAHGIKKTKEHYFASTREALCLNYCYNFVIHMMEKSLAYFFHSFDTKWFLSRSKTIQRLTLLFSLSCSMKNRVKSRCRNYERNISFLCKKGMQKLGKLHGTEFRSLSRSGHKIKGLFYHNKCLWKPSKLKLQSTWQTHHIYKWRWANGKKQHCNKKIPKRTFKNW